MVFSFTQIKKHSSSLFLDKKFCTFFEDRTKMKKPCVIKQPLFSCDVVLPYCIIWYLLVLYFCTGLLNANEIQIQLKLQSYINYSLTLKCQEQSHGYI